MSVVLALDEPVLERIFAFAASHVVGPLDWQTLPDYGTLKACALVCQPWRYPAQSILAKHVRIASPQAMQAIRTREAKRQLAQHTTLVLESIYQFGADTYWLLDRFPKLEAFRLEYDVLRGGDGQAERDEDWLTWDVLRHPSLTGITDLYCKADFEEPEDTSLLSFPITRLALGCLPLEHAPGLHKAVFTGCKATLQDISLDFRPTADKDGLDSLIAEFQAGVALTLEHLHFLNKPNINFLMSMHSKMNASKMPRFYSVSYPLLPNALAPFNILALAVVNNGTALVEFGLVEPPYLPLASNEEHEALVLRYIAAFGSRLDSFNMMGRRFRFRFPRDWPARFVRLPEIARFLDRAGARGCDVWCGSEQKFESTAKAMEKRKGKRVANGSSQAENDSDDQRAPTLDQLQRVLAHAALPSSSSSARRAPPPLVPDGAKAAVNGASKGKGKGKAVDKGKGKAVDKGKGKAVDKGKGKGKAKEQYVAPPPGEPRAARHVFSAVFAPPPHAEPTMSVFSSKGRKAHEAVAGLDATSVLRSAGAWQLAQLATLGIGSDLTAIAYDPVQSLLAVGTEHGRLFVFGKPGVQLSWELGYPSKIRHLAFRSGSGFLCLVDAKDTLYVFDLQRLDGHGRPTRDSSTSLRTNVTCIETSAAHAFLYIGGKDGTVDVYDLDRGVLAPHARIPNLWLEQEELLRRSGVPDAPSRRHIPVCTDVKTHPLNLNLVLVAYEGGVSLWNLATKQSERTWEFVLPPGAPGGGNDTDQTLFAERRPAVTCLAWRPDGLLFAAGHDDGTISFAAMDDDNPVMLRTIERADVNKATEEDLFGWSAPGQGGQRQPANREPIFRLAWSGFPQETYLAKAFASAGAASSSAVPSPSSVMADKTDLHGGTVLTILGGLRPSDPVGVHVFEFPAYVPPPAATAKTGNMPVAVREALRASITPSAHHLYPTPAPAEDFLLLPRSSPHYGGAYDPNAIVITSGRDERCPVLPAPHSALNIEAFTFPPSLTRAPRPLHLPPALSFSGNATCSSAIVKLANSASYRQMLHQFDLADETAERLPLHGGRAFPKARPTRRGPPPSSGDQDPRILVTSHVDLSVRLWDISTKVLWGQKPEDGAKPYIDEDFPRPLRHLDVDVRSLLRDPRMQDTLAARLLRERPWELEIAQVAFAEETLELAITLSTGDVVIYRFAYGGHPADIEVDRIEAEADLDDTVQGALRDMSLSPDRLPPPPTFAYEQHPAQAPSSSSHPARKRFGSLAHRPGSSRRDSHATETFALDPEDLHIDLSGAIVPRPDLDGFRPLAAYRSLTQEMLARSCLSLSNIGFLASSNGSHLLVVDLRGPEVLHFEAAGSSPAGKGKGRPDTSPIVSLTWTVCAIGEDHDRSPRLLVTQESGLTRVFEVANVGGSWHISSQPVPVAHDSARGAVASFVIDKAGDELLADAQRLQLSQAYQGQALDASGAPASLWIVVTRTSASCYYNVDGLKIAEYVDERERFEKAVIVHQQGCAALIVQSRSCAMYTFSLPDLQQVSRMKFETTLHDSAGVFAFAPDGDFAQHLDPFNIRLGTVRDLYRPDFPPQIDLFNPNKYVPVQTSALQSVGSVFGTWFGGRKVYTGAEMDTILGGPNRPPPKQRVQSGAPIPLATTTRKQPTAAAAAAAGWGLPSQTEFVQGASESARDIMARTNAALAQRGEYLQTIQDRLGSALDDAAEFAKETKKTAQQEAAKKSFATGFASLWNKVP